MAEREGFEPPMGLHPCRISSAVHSTTLPPLQAFEDIHKIGLAGWLKLPFATALLPNVFGRALLYRQTHRFVNAGNSIFLHSRQNMAV